MCPSPNTAGWKTSEIFSSACFGNTDFDVDSISYHDSFSSSDAQNIDFITDHKKKETEVPL
jgi:hypothetical protein